MSLEETRRDFGSRVYARGNTRRNADVQGETRMQQDTLYCVE